MSPPKSQVWDYFIKRDSISAICQICSKQIKHCSSTSNLHKHIKKHRAGLPASFKRIPKMETGTLSKKKKIKSPVWDYFSNIESMYAICKFCSKKIKHCMSTSNLQKHLNRHKIGPPSKIEKKEIIKTGEVQPELKIENNENILVNDCELPDPTEKRNSARSDDFDVEALIESCIEQEDEDSDPLDCISQGYESTGHTEESKKSYIITNKGIFSKHQNNIDLFLYFICKDAYNPEIVDGEGFLNLCYNLNPNLKVPSSLQLKQRICSKFETITRLLKLKITDLNNVCLTLNTLMFEKCFLTATIHFFDGTRKQSYHIATKELQKNYTSYFIVEVLSAILSEWNLPRTKIQCIISDATTTKISDGVKNAVSENRHLPCFLKSLSLIVEVATQNASMQDIFEKVRNIVNWVNSDFANSEKLKSIQNTSNISKEPIKKLCLDFSTKGEFLFGMTKIFLELKDHCSELLLGDRTSPDMLVPSEIEMLKEFHLLLKPFESIYKELSKNIYAPLSLVIPMVNFLKIEISNFISKNDVINDIREAVQMELNNKFSSIEYKTIAAFATLLDPRFKGIHFRDSIAYSSAVKKLEQILNTNSNVIKRKNVEDEFDFWAHHKELVYGPRNEDELAAYLERPLLSAKTSPLVHWEDMKTIFPLLYNQAQNYLMIPASHVPCKDFFNSVDSTQAHIVKSMTENYLEKISFLSSVEKDLFFK